MKMSYRIRRNMIFEKFSVDVNALQKWMNLLPQTEFGAIKKSFDADNECYVKSKDRIAIKCMK